jgi:hypothetical protein
MVITPNILISCGIIAPASEDGGTGDAHDNALLLEAVSSLLPAPVSCAWRCSCSPSQGNGDSGGLAVFYIHPFKQVPIILYLG